MKLRHLLSSLALLAPLPLAHAKYVFAHVVVGNTAAHSVSTWSQDISLAAASGIDAFVLNIGHGDSNIAPQVANAFSAATTAAGNFKLLLAFDYLGGGSVWPASEVVDYLNQYKGNSAYFLYNGLPFVSTFEGTANVDDWAPGAAIRGAVGEVYFVPDWSSLGASGVATHSSNIEGAFSWALWPDGANNMTTGTDLWYQNTLTDKSYMMGVSPWFFHSASGGYQWVWRGDDLWADRWAQVLEIQPEFVQIVSWNDFAESHYIGPIHSFNEVAAGSEVYVTGLAHDSWRDFLPYYIATYKGDTFDISRDQMQYWYRLHAGTAGSACGVLGYNPDQNPFVDLNTVMEDGVYFSALLKEAGEVHVQIGNGPVVVKSGAQGINHWSIPFNGQTGVPYFSVWRSGVLVQGASGLAISAMPLSNGCSNYNPYVGSF